MALTVLVVLGLGLLAGGGAGLRHELTRKATAAEATAALQAEIATRWRRLPAGKIFPATVSYRDAQYQVATARLVGIAQPESCAAALEPGALAQMEPGSCATLLHATYVDSTMTLAATVAVAVMTSAPAAAHAQRMLAAIAPDGGLHAQPFSGTVTSTYSDAQRAAAGTAVSGPYLFVYTVGYTDGLPGSAGAGVGPDQLGTGLLAALQEALTGHGPPCSMADIRC